MTARVLNGDALECLRCMPSNSVDALVTDPPAGIGFMGKEWDADKGGRAQWVAWLADVMREALRVLKPGAHGLVWALPRTSHWTGWALETAGFEVRDRVSHLFGNGFPKSLNVSKAIDDAAGAEREVVGPNRFAGVNGRANLNVYGIASRPDESAPATPEAAQWEGFGTALKPACEDWWLVRKPLSEGTVATNVLAHGTGGLNVDGCRVGTEVITTHNTPGVDKFNNLYSGSMVPKGGDTTHLGRWPANLVLDEAAAQALDAQSEESKSSPSGSVARGQRKPSAHTFSLPPMTRRHGYGDFGGASRFFYCAKASRKERGKGNTHPTVKPVALMRWLCRLVTPPGGLVLDPFTGSGTTGVAAKLEGFRFIGIERETAYVQLALSRLWEAA